MKEPFSLERGRIVQSLQGRDKGKHFVVLQTEEADWVYLANGESRKLDKPKKKKTKHVRAKPVLLNLNTLRPEGGQLQDSDLRKALEANGFADERSLCKEG